MKWIAGLLLALNIIVFVLADITDVKNTNKLSEIPSGVGDIKLVASIPDQVIGSCINVGPIKQQIALARFEKLLSEKLHSYRIISESVRKVFAYRVLIESSKTDDFEDMKKRLKLAGVEEIYQKKLNSDKAILSLGVFTYIQTAQNFANSLVKNKFPAFVQRETLEFPQRYWLNLDKSLDKQILAQMNNYIGAGALKQYSAVCIAS